MEEDYTTDTGDDTDSIFDSDDEYDEFGSDIEGHGYRLRSLEEDR